VCAFHVLEHTTRPQEFLRAALALLRPGGLLALEVPNFAGRHARRAGASWIGLQPRYHALQFSTRSLRALLERVGFEPLSVETFWHQGYELPTERRRLRSLAVRGARALRTRRLGPVHPSEGDYVRALALRPARPGSTST
jgi:SAM-dependent methyltransferase